MKKKKLVLNCKLKKNLRMYKLNKDEKLDYQKYEKMNELWKGYVYSCLSTCLSKSMNSSKEITYSLNEENILNCLKQIDYHGCILTVTKSTSKYHVGIRGIVLQDKKNIFVLLTKENTIKLVPKLGSLFEFELINDCKITVVGSNMCIRPEMRTTKHAKIKTKKNLF